MNAATKFTSLILISLQISALPLACAQNELSVNYQPAEAGKLESRAEYSPSSSSGFKDLSFGQTIASVKGLKLVSTTGSKAIYTRPSDLMLIGNEPAERIEYHFFQDRFCGVVVTLKNQYLTTTANVSPDKLQNEHPFITALRQEYGAPDYEQQATLTWLDGDVMLQVRKNSENIDISYTDTAINKLMSSEN